MRTPLLLAASLSLLAACNSNKPAAGAADDSKSPGPATIVIQNVKVKDSGNRDVNGNATPSPVLTGTGKVTVLRDGKVWRGTWSRPKATSPTVFAVGDERLMFAPGQVWVLLVPNGQKVTVS